MSAARDRKTVRNRDGAVGLRYVGDGAAIPDVPARDLSTDELAEIAERLIDQAERDEAERPPTSDPIPVPIPTPRSIRQLLLDSGLYVEAPDTAPAPPAESEV